MNSAKKNEVSGGADNFQDHIFYVESEEETCSGCIQAEKSPKLSRDRSPPLLLAFSISAGDTQRQTSSVSSPGSQQQAEEESDQSVEEWMILGGEDQKEDPSIQLNLGSWVSSEEDSEDEDEKVKSEGDTWAVSDRDKYGDFQSLANRYFMAGRSSICNICNRTGHFAKNCCFYKKCPTCVLCGVRGHVRRDCPSRPCSTCGQPSHALEPCRVPPVWKQHCQRCGVTGHTTDACPDTWRQYHLTVKFGVPFRPRALCSLKHRSHLAYCYNCSKRGHYGHECTKRRMISGTFASLPYVCRYDTLEDILQQSNKTLTAAKEVVSAGALPSSQQKQLGQKAGDCFRVQSSVQGRSKTKLDAGVHPGRRKTWPERRRERREVKRLRREAQAKRGIGILRRLCCTSDEAFCTADPFRQILHSQTQSKPPQEKKRREEKAVKRSRKSREAERWKKRGGFKRGDLYPHSDIEIGSENFLSPKQRVRHRRR